jgi:hypothetical protein
VSSGDQFVGRALSLLPILQTEFGASPPHFVGIEQETWVEDLQVSQFPMIQLVAGFGRLLLMCLASVLFHRVWLMDTLDINHVFLITSNAFRNGELFEKLNDNTEWIQVTYPWNDIDKAFSGIPPHVSVLQELSLIKNKQGQLVKEIVAEMKTVVEQLGADGGRMSEENLRTLFSNLEERLVSRIGTSTAVANPLAALANNHVENGRTYYLHYYGGFYKRVPADWRFPRCGVQDLWRHWWIGDSVRQIPPLRCRTNEDVKHLDLMPLAEEEKHGRKGKHNEQRRPGRKTLADIKYLMTFIEKKVTSVDAREVTITIATVDKMYKAVVDCFDIKQRDAQLRWTTVVNSVRGKKIT